VNSTHRQNGENIIMQEKLKGKKLDLMQQPLDPLHHLFPSINCTSNMKEQPFILFTQFFHLIILQETGSSHHNPNLITCNGHLTHSNHLIILHETGSSQHNPNKVKIWDQISLVTADD